MPPHRDTIVVGASAGGVPALRTLLGMLPADLDAAVLIVMHQARNAGQLDRVLREISVLPLGFVTEAETLRPGRVYLAPPDVHMIVAGERVMTTAGPLEMRARPAINPLFRTAAASRSGRVVAIQLTGLLDDGVAGLAAVKRCGGRVLVQDPDEAEYPEMPRCAIEAVDVDHVAPLARLAELLPVLVAEPAPDIAVPGDIAIEARLSGPAPDGEPSRPEDVQRIGEPIACACPDCGGPLWQVGRGDTAVYRCHVGHSLSARGLLGAQHEVIERALWVAVRSLTERASTLDKLAESAERGGTRASESYRRRAAEATTHSDTVRRFLLSLHEEPSVPPDDAPERKIGG